MHTIIFLLIGGIAGWLAGVVMRGGGFGMILDIILGVLGGWFGGWLGNKLGIHLAGNWGYFITAFVGAVVLVGITRLIKRA